MSIFDRQCKHSVYSMKELPNNAMIDKRVWCIGYKGLYQLVVLHCRHFGWFWNALVGAHTEHCCHILVSEVNSQAARKCY